MIIIIFQNWPICKAQCDNQVIWDKLPKEDTKLELWMEHPDHDVVSLMLHLLYFTFSYV